MITEVPKLLLLVGLVGLLSILIYVALAATRRLRRRANQFGYDGVLAYLRAVPKDEAEKRAAVDLAMQGVVLCLLGITFFPLMLIGIFPLYYGGRKLILVGLGLGSGLPSVGP